MTGTGAATFSVTNYSNNYRFFIDEFTLADKAPSGVAPVWGTIGTFDTTVDDGVAETMTDYLTTVGTPAPTITVSSTGANTPAGSAYMDGNDFYFIPDAADAGKQFVFTFTASNASGTRTQTMTVNVAAAVVDYSTATWLGNSYIVFNGTWYNGSNGDAGKSAFNGHDFGAQTAITLGGQAQTYGDNSASGHIVEMQYSVYPSTGSASTWNKADMVWFDYANNNNWFRTGAAYNEATVDIANLAAGSYKLNVYFQQQTGASSWIYDSNSGNNFIADFSIAATLSRTPTSLSGFSTESGTASAAQSFSVTATHLNGNLTVTAPTGYEVSTSSGSGYAGSVTLSRDANNKVTGQTVYVRLKSDAAVGSRTGNVTVSGGGTTQVTVSLTGGVTPKPPTKGTVSYPSNEAEGRVVIPWTKNTAGNDVMVVRVANNGTAPSPANGTAYSTGSGLGGQIVYKGSATSHKDTGLTAGTDYDYYLFSVSGNYYSTGVKVDATASKAPRFATSSVSKSTTVGGTASNTQTASGTPSGMTYSVTCTSGGATSGFSVNSSGVFSFTPTAAGTFVFTVSAANGVTAVSASSYQITVTVNAAAPTVGTPSRSGTTATGATLGGTVSATGGATLTEWGVVYSATSLNTDPTVGGTGCTNVTASGTPGESAFTAAVTGLKANTEYKWKAYAVNSVGTGYTAVQTFTTPCMSSGPVVTPEGLNGGAKFTWNDVGAVQYLLSLWTGGGAASRTETFNSSSLSGSSYTGNTSITGGDLGTWSSSGARGDQTTIDGKAPIIRYGNTLTSPTLPIAFSQVSFQYAWPYSESGSWEMELYIGSTLAGSYTVTGGTAGTATYTGLSGAVGDTITIKNASTATSNKRILIDNIVISGSGGTYVSGYGADGGEVTSPVTVSGLTSGTTYNWSLKAVGGGTGCEEDGTPYGTNTYVVTPTAADVAPAWASTVGPWSATVSTLLSQDMTDYITAGSPAPTFTVAAQGTAPAGSYGVTEGVFTFTPAEGDAGKSFVFRFTASNTQGSPTKDVTVNVGALAPTIAEGTKTIGTTSATLPVTVNMRGAATSADITLVYGTTASGTQGSSASVSPTRITTGLNAGTAVTGTIASGLEPGTTYSYKWTVQNSAGTTTKTGTFTTLDVAPAVASAGSLNVTVNTGATATLAASSWVTAGTHLTYALSTTVSSSLYTWTAGTGTLAFRPTATGTYTFNLTASNGRGSATYAWTVTVANAPTITKGEASTSGTSATVPATIHAGGAATTVTFQYGTAEGTYNLNPASLSGGSVAAGATAAAASASLTGLTQGTTYYYQWTAVNAGGTTVETGSFFQPGDGLEFPGQMNGWAQSGTTTRDAEFGGGNYYYTPATRLTGDQLFKAYKGGTWYGNGYWVTGNNSGHVFTVNENTAENKLCVTETGGGFPPSGAGYYTLRGHDTGSGIEYVALYTENAPVTFTGASDNHAARGTADVTVTATLSGAKSASEKVYLRYTTDGWTTSSLVQMSGSGTSYTGTIPGQGKGTTVEWYVLTSPHDAVADHVDLCTLRGLKNGTDNFTYTTTLLPPTVNTVEAGYEKVALAWDLNAAGNAVMVIRYASLLPTITPPSDGTAYAADTSALGGTVVYGAYAHPSGSETLDNVVSQGTGYTYVFYSVEGSGGSSKYSEGVVRSALSLSLATPTVGVTTAGAGTLTGAAADSGEIYVVARIAGSGSFSGTPSGAAPNAGQPLCGGTVVYKGTAGSFTVADMQGCQTYKYMAWLHAADEDAWSAGSSVATVSMPTPSAPVLNALADITYQGFTASWNAVPGAVTYRMDIVKGGGTGAAVLSADFADAGLSTENSYPSGEQTRTISGQTWLTTAVMTKPEGTSNGAGSTGFLQMQANNGIIVLPTLNGVKTVKVVARGTNALKLQRKVNGAWDTDHPLETWTLTSTGTEYTHTFESVQDGISLRIVGDTSNAKYVHDVTVLGEGTTPVAGWTDKDVGSLMTVSGGVVSVEVEGLDELTTYSVTVRAEGATAACASADSNTQSATTLENDTVTTVTISDANGAEGASAVAAGVVAAGQTALVQGTKLVVAAGTVNPTLTGVTFTTTGTAGTDDLATFQVRVGTSATFAGTETVKGTVTAGAAGSHTVTFGSAQTLTAEQTYYVWIEAATKAGATGGKTVGVAALTKDAFATTGARKTGSTAATGAQTIGNLSSLSAAAVTGRADQGAVMSVSFGRSLAAADSGVLIRWSDVGYSEIPAPGTAWTKETTVAAGTASPVEVSGLTACKTYYFKAWEVVGSAVAGTAKQASGTVSAPAAPTGLGHGTPGAHNASLTWSAAAGATGYVIDLWHYEGGSDGSGDGGEGIDGTYTEITSTADFTDGGYYVLVNSNNVAMNSTVTSSKFQSSAVEISGTTLTDPPAEAVWQAIEYEDGTFALKNASTETIATANTNNTNVKLVSEGNMEYGSYWWVSCNGTTWRFLNDGGQQNRALFASSDVWGNYGTNNTGKPYSMPRVFKRSGGSGASGTRVDDVIAGEVQSGSSVTVTTNGTTGVNLGGLTDGTTYGWDVKALGTECESAASASDTFTTAELLGAPTIVEPLTVGVEQLSGTITGAAGAQMILKRYESEDAALAATADGSLGGVPVTATEGTGAAAGTWTFTDTGLDGCKTYYYRAWQKATVDGEQATSSGSNVASAQTELGTPTVAAVGAGTQMTISWNAVPGAVSYKVMLTDTEGVWTTTGGGSGTTQLSMDFAGITANNTELNTAANLTANGLTGWGATKVWTVVEEGEGATTLKYVKLGSTSYGGSLATPQISAMSAGGKATFDLKTFTGGNGKSDSSTVTVAIKYTGDADFEPLKTFTPSADWQNYQVSITGTKAFQLQLSSSAGNNRFHIDNLVVTENGSGGGSSGKVGLKYEATVTSAPFERTVDGLTMGETYWYKVIATGAEGCEKTSAVESGTPANAPLIQVTPMHYNFGTVNKNEGGATATFTVRNTGSIALKFNAVTLEQGTGTAYSITEPVMVVQRTADLDPGASRTYTVTFNPTNSGLRTATLRFVNDAYNVTGEIPPASGTPTYGNLDIPLTGTCFDPATADPTVYWLKVEDELGIEDTVTDESMAHEDHEPMLTVLTWHYNRSYRTLSGEKAARWTLYDPSGNVATKANGAALENQLFEEVEDYVYDGKTCAKFSAPIPALGTGKAVRGTYTVKVKVYDSTGTYWTETTHFVPIETGWLFDDFTRADREATGSGALENGWTAMTSGSAVAGEAAIHADALELYGANGECPGEAGRIAVARDMSDVGYATDPHDFVGTGSWGFHFKTGAKTVGFGNGSTAGAFVLGSTASTWLTDTPGQVGYAVAMMEDAVRLVKFEGSLLAGGTITQLGEAQFAGAQGKLLAVRVDFLPGQDEVDADAADDGVAHAAVPAKYRLYVKEVEKTGGSPIAECTAADKVLEWEFPSPEDHNLRYAGMMWNHGTAQVSDKTGAMFDDIYLPHMEGQTEPMMFHVIDEDTEGPEFYGISLRGAVAAPDVARDGLTVTGMVHDASGVAGTVAWAMYNGETLLTSGTATPAAVSGSSTEYTVSCTILAGAIDGSIRSADCRFVLTASDGDDDRSEGGTNIDSTEGTGSFPFTFSASTPAAPGWATAEADGAEMVVMRWARVSAGTEYIVVRSDEEIGEQASPQGRTGSGSMAEGTTVDGWGKVVYRGTGDEHLSGTWTAREFIVGPGSTNYFAVYGMTGDDSTGHYFSAPTKPTAYKWATTNETGAVTVHRAVDSSGVPVSSSVAEGGWPCTTAPYEPGEGVDSFAYRTSVTEIGDTNAQRLALAFNYEPRPETGSGWGGAWTGAVDRFKIHDENLLSEGTHFPTPAGNKLYWNDGSQNTPDEASLYRPLASTYGGGHFFVAGLINFLNGGDGKYVNIVLVDDEGNDLMSFGKQGGTSGNNAAIYIPSTTFGTEHTLSNTGGNADYGLTPGHGQDYVIAGEVDWENKMVRMWVFFGGSGSTAAIPQVYEDLHNTITNTTALEAVQASWEWKNEAPNWAGKVAGIRLVAGSGTSGDLGHVYFDEIRFATTWPELFLFNDPEVYTYDFDKPDDKTGRLDPVNPTDDEGHNQWQISDGALAHGDVGLNAQFGLFHRTGIAGARFTIQDAAGTNLLKAAATSGADTTAATTNQDAIVTLKGKTGGSYSDWATTNAAGAFGGAVGVAIPTEWISLDSNYVVEVTLTSAGGREATVTAASETGGGGATDLFIGEYGEGSYWDKYIELYNGTGKDIDLYNYYIFRPKKNQTWGDYSSLIPDNAHPFVRLALTPETNILHHKETIVLLNRDNPAQSDSYKCITTNKTTGVVTTNTVSFTAADRLAALEAGLTAAGARFQVMPDEILNAGGDVPYLLIAATNFNESVVTNAAKNGTAVSLTHLDACGLASLVFAEGRSSERYIMSRKDTAQKLPRPAPLTIAPSEWDYRDWGWPKSNWRYDDYSTDLDENAVHQDDLEKYTNVVATAGQYDRLIGLGGNMEFKVYDDDIEAPTLKGGGVTVGSRSVEGETGDRTYVMGGWSFTNWPAGKSSAGELVLTNYQWIAEMWPYGMTTNGGVSWSPLLGGDDLAGWANVIEAGEGRGQSNVEFDGLSQRKYGCMVAHAATNYAKTDEVWLGFDMDVSKLSDAVLTFGWAGGSAGFENARVEVSTTGQEGSFKMPNEWEFTANNTGGATTWTEWSGEMKEAIKAIPEVATAGHLWFRVVLKNYGTASGTFRMDNMRLEGAPEMLRVSDEELGSQTVAFAAQVQDELSGLDEGTAKFTYGVTNVTLTKSQSLVDGGKRESTFTWTKTGGFTKAEVQEWYTQSQDGKTQLRVEIDDKDDDRVGDALTMTADYGTLDVYDDDDEPPELEMASMKPRLEGVFAEWKPKEKTTVPSETMERVDVGALGLDTDAGTTSKPRYSGVGDGDAKTYAVYQSGWQAGSKYWTAVVSNGVAGAGNITKVRFQSKVGSVLAPTGFEVKWGTVAHGETAAATTASAGTGSLLKSGTAWVKEGSDATGSPIKTWAEYELAVEIPLAAAGETGDAVEVRIYGTGTDPDGIGATWYLWDLAIEGEITPPAGEGSDGYTYVTDNELAGAGGAATLRMEGNLWDPSGLGADPTYVLSNGTTTVTSGTITGFTTEDKAARTTKATGAFSQEITVGGQGYEGVKLAEYKGSIHAVDADHDREDSSGNNTDQAAMDGLFAFTVVDQDLVGPSAPANVTVNGTAVAGEPDRLTAAWTNKPEFLVAFDVAHDIVPTEANLTGTEKQDVLWRQVHDVDSASVKKASIQNVATGVGEYRVALATDAATMSNAPAFSVAATNGALANYGFERGYKGYDGDIGWTCAASGSGIGWGDKVGGVYPVAEGTNSYYLQANAAASQIIPFAASDSGQTLTVDLSLKIYKRAAGSIVYAKFEFSDDEETWTSAIGDVALNSGSGGDLQTNWLSKTMATKTLTAPAGAKYLRFSLRMNGSTANIDDVRLSVRVGAAPAEGTADRATMRYVATGPEAQGLNAKYLFAADADNDRKQDRRIGEAAPFHTAYDCTPPTRVGMNHGTGASTEDVDDPTTQMKLTWSTSGVGPDDTGHDNYLALPDGLKKGVDSLSPWRTYKVYYSAYDPALVDAALATEGESVTNYFYETFLKEGAAGDGTQEAGKGRYTAWASVTADSSIEDSTAPATAYSGMRNVATPSVTVYDLENDLEYVFVTVGVDAAGNEGPATSASWATNNTIKFAVTQGVVRTAAAIQAALPPAGGETALTDKFSGQKQGAALYWLAAGMHENEETHEMSGRVRKQYDLIYRDAGSFTEKGTEGWIREGTTQTNWNYQAGNFEDLGRRKLRFYRASYHDRWQDAVTNTVTNTVAGANNQTTNVVKKQMPLASEDVYSMGRVRLLAGANYVGLQGLPWTNTLAGVFGMDWPSTNRVGDCTLVEFYNEKGVASEKYRLQPLSPVGTNPPPSGAKQWVKVGTNPLEDWTNEELPASFFARGFAIWLPTNYPAEFREFETESGVPGMTWYPMMQVPTNAPRAWNPQLEGWKERSGDPGNFTYATSGDTNIQPGKLYYHANGKQVDPTVFSVEVTYGGRSEDGRDIDPRITLVNLNLPVAVNVADLGLVKTNADGSWKGGILPGNGTTIGDVIYTYDNEHKKVRDNSLMYWSQSEHKWKNSYGTGLTICPNDAILIKSMGERTPGPEGGGKWPAKDDTWTWTYSPTNFYQLPTRHMGRERTQQ